MGKVPTSQVELAAQSTPAAEVRSSVLNEIQDAIKSKLGVNNGGPHVDLTCSCQPGCGNVTCSEDTCPVRRNHVECDSNCHSLCQNRRIQQDQFVVSLFIDSRQAYGCCLATSAIIPRGTVIVEYVGVVTFGDPHFNQSFAYPIIKYKGKHDKYVNSLKYGNESRFLQHSASPNCLIQEWVVENQLRLIVIARTSIAKNEVLTISYPQRAFPNKYQRISEADLVREECEQERAAGIPEITLDLKAFRHKFAEYKDESGGYWCNYGRCAQQFSSEETLAQHKEDYHHAQLPSFSCDKDTLFRPPTPQKKKRAKASKEDKWKYEDDVVEGCLLYHRELENPNLYLETAADRLDALQDIAEQSEKRSRKLLKKIEKAIHAEEERLLLEEQRLEQQSRRLTVEEQLDELEDEEIRRLEFGQTAAAKIRSQLPPCYSPGASESD